MGIMEISRALLAPRILHWVSQNAAFDRAVTSPSTPEQALVVQCKIPFALAKPRSARPGFLAARNAFGNLGLKGRRPKGEPLVFHLVD